MKTLKRTLKTAAAAFLALIACFALVCIWLVVGALLDAPEPVDHPKATQVTV